MKKKNEKPRVSKVEEPAVEYEVQKSNFKGIDRKTFDFDTEFAKGLTPEEFKAEIFKRIEAYSWKK